LIVDDDETFYDIVKHQLQPLCGEFGLGYLWADGMSVARDILGRHGEAIRVAVMDLRMPEENGLPGSIDQDAGIKLCREIHDQGHGFSIVVHTQRFDRQAKDQCALIPGIKYYVERPWVMEALQEAVRRSLTGEAPDKMEIVETGQVLEDMVHDEEVS
jgi:CheY-like chemotaxis protein